MSLPARKSFVPPSGGSLKLYILYPNYFNTPVCDFFKIYLTFLKYLFIFPLTGYLHHCCLAVKPIPTLEIAEELLQLGADVNAQEGKGRFAETSYLFFF